MIVVSGGYDPVHIGHIRLFRAAAEYGDLTVILNSDDWLLRKKGFVFMPWEERAEILQAIRYVTNVVSVDDSDDTICEALVRLKPKYFANGGDRNGPDPAEHFVCQRHMIQELFNVGGQKIQSSSQLTGGRR